MKRNFTWHKDLVNLPIDVNEVLVEDDKYNDHKLVFHFVGYTKALFVPRSAIMDALNKNERAWADCAKWRYFQAAFILYSLEEGVVEDFKDCL